MKTHQELRDSQPWLLISSVCLVDMEILGAYEACTKFPIGGMYVTLAQALLQSLKFSDRSSLAQLQQQYNVVQKKKSIEIMTKKSGHQVRTQMVDL